MVVHLKSKAWIRLEEKARVGKYRKTKRGWSPWATGPQKVELVDYRPSKG